MEEAARTGAATVVTACPFCLHMFQNAVKSLGMPARIRDVAELMEETLSGLQKRDLCTS